jgi:Ca2+-binding EF-hand superfamily protein
MSAEIKKILNNNDIFNEATLRVFESVDIEKSGTISTSELAYALIQFTKDLNIGPVGEEDAEEVVRHIDAGGSGMACINEFRVLCRDIIEALNEEN